MVPCYTCHPKELRYLHLYSLLFAFTFRLRITMLAFTLLRMLPPTTQFLFPPIRAVLGLVVIVSFILPLLYNRYFHPLRKFPGPFWGSLMDAYHTYLMWRKSSHTEQLDLRKKHGQSSCCYFPSRIPAQSKLITQTGPVVRLTPNLLSVGDPSMILELYQSHTDKTSFYCPGIMGESPPLLQIQPEKAHNARLKTLAPSVSLTVILLVGRVL